MKKLLTCILFAISIACIRPSYAQTMFAPPGAEWYHSIGSMGVFHSYYTGDTVIAGINCRGVARIPIVEPPWSTMGFHIYTLSTLYFYNNEDTVFVYNVIFNRFTPLYVFNVSDGDTVRLPILPPEVNDFSGSYPDSTFAFVVDSVRMVLYDTATLKTVFTRSIGNCATNYVYAYGDSVGAYAERVGGIPIGLSPQYRCGVNLLDMSYQTQGPLRCYSDPTLSVKLVVGLCGAPPSTEAPAINDPGVNIFPDPATDFVNIVIKTKSGMRIGIFNIEGKEVMKEMITPDTQAASINVSQLPAGTYSLKLWINGLPQAYKLISVVH